MDKLEKKRDAILAINTALNCAYSTKGLSEFVQGQLWGYMTILLKATGMQTAAEINAVITAIMRQLKDMTEGTGWEPRMFGAFDVAIALSQNLLFDPTEEALKPCNKEQ